MAEDVRYETISGRVVEAGLRYIPDRRARDSVCAAIDRVLGRRALQTVLDRRQVVWIVEDEHLGVCVRISCSIYSYPACSSTLALDLRGLQRQQVSFWKRTASHAERGSGSLGSL